MQEDGRLASGIHTANCKLSYFYGPEHQRIRQSVTFTGSGTRSYFIGGVNTAEPGIP